ncbi:TPA: hypothetical protein I8Y21_005046 [Klebsiella oxytoca]|uniref:Gp11 C-terminal domain-containing protein n=1 Tax=Klebsiella oxytoca TaxID=571 RepID=A0AAN5LCM3_KLEOX|nr:hypothetical protein [Klebsiella oxytoca]
MLDNITTLINRYGPATCQMLTDRLGHKPADVIPVLRRGVELQLFDDVNGFYRIKDEKNASRRKSHAWVEGTVVTHDVVMLSLAGWGDNCLSVVAELNRAGQKKGHPPFVIATLNPGQRTFTSSSTGDFITGFVVRYMPLDTHIVRSL